MSTRFKLRDDAPFGYRSAGFLDDVAHAFTTTPTLANLIMAPEFSDILERSIPALRSVVTTAIVGGIPVPALSASLAYFDAYVSDRLPANLIQAQRDFFGAHRYQRTDRPGDFHSDWSTAE